MRATAHKLNRARPTRTTSSQPLNVMARKVRVPRQGAHREGPRARRRRRDPQPAHVALVREGSPVDFIVQSRRPSRPTARRSATAGRRCPARLLVSGTASSTPASRSRAQDKVVFVPCAGASRRPGATSSSVSTAARRPPRSRSSTWRRRIVASHYGRTLGDRSLRAALPRGARADQAALGEAPARASACRHHRLSRELLSVCETPGIYNGSPCHVLRPTSTPSSRSAARTRVSAQPRRWTTR